MNAWIVSDPQFDENEIDFGDYDNDGDLDAFVANFAGENYLYQSGIAQGLDPDTQGPVHRTGGGGSLAAAFLELPSNFNGGTSLDGEWADLDNDGDLEICSATTATRATACSGTSWACPTRTRRPSTRSPCRGTRRTAPTP
jgi:hypothetical protein